MHMHSAFLHKLTKNQLVRTLIMFHESLPSNQSPNTSPTFPLYIYNPFSLTHSTLIQLQTFAMATHKCTLLILSFLLFAAFTSGCGTCEPKPTPKPKPKPKPLTPKAPPVNPFCPRDTLKLGACADLLGLVNLVLGTPPSGDKCCALLQGLADLEVAACLCTAIKANVLGINLNVPIALSALVSACGKTIPPGYKCV